MSLSSCCTTGFAWSGSPKGKETTLAGVPAYVTGDNKSAAVLIVHDIYGWTMTNTRLLADHYAEEAGVTVYLPDFFDGEVVPTNRLDPNYDGPPMDLNAFVERHNKDLRWPTISGCAKALKGELGFKKLGAIGFCYGGWAVLRLGSKEHALVDCVSTAHPAMFENADVDALGHCPIQFIAPEEDFTFTPELKEYVLKTMPTLGIDWAYQYFAGLKHGFATRGDVNNPIQKQGLERAKNVAVSWFRQYLQ